jgi:hypothetical protein
VSIRTMPGDPAPDTLSIPKERWHPTPVQANVSPAPRPRLSMLIWLLLIALIGGHASALSSTAHHAALASALLPATLVALVRSGYAATRHATSAVGHRRPETD